MATIDKNHEIRLAALQLIAEFGFHAAPIAKIAERAGVGAGTIYRYFANKDLLIAELFREIHGQVVAALLAGYEPEQPVRERFLQLSTALLRYFLDHPLHFRFLEQYLNSPYGIAYRRERIMGKGDDENLLCAVLEEGVAQKIIKDLPLAVLFALTFGPLRAVARDHVVGLVALDESLIIQTAQACWDGLKK